MATESRLLGLPLELRLMILDFVFAELPRDEHGDLIGHANGWVPPPILQSCQQLRIEGLPNFLSNDMAFEVCDFDIEQIRTAQSWARNVSKYYKLKVRSAIVSYVFPTRNKESAHTNLWSWLAGFYFEDLHALFHAEDIQRPDILRGHCELLDDKDSRGNLEQYTEPFDHSRI
jgi:hypothetical protein